MLTAPVYTLLLLGVIVGLGAAFVWMFWEADQAAPSSRSLRGGRQTAAPGQPAIARRPASPHCADRLRKNKAVDAV